MIVKHAGTLHRVSACRATHIYDEENIRDENRNDDRKNYENEFSQPREVSKENSEIDRENHERESPRLRDDSRRNSDSRNDRRNNLVDWAPRDEEVSDHRVNENDRDISIRLETSNTENHESNEGRNLPSRIDLGR